MSDYVLLALDIMRHANISDAFILGVGIGLVYVGCKELMTYLKKL